MGVETWLTSHGFEKRGNLYVAKNCSHIHVEYVPSTNCWVVGHELPMHTYRYFDTEGVAGCVTLLLAETLELVL